MCCELEALKKLLPVTKEIILFLANIYSLLNTVGLFFLSFSCARTKILPACEFASSQLNRLLKRSYHAMVAKTHATQDEWKKVIKVA